jgi:hypothetical protein
MSVPVALAELAARITEFGPVAYLVTVGADPVPHMVSVAVAWQGDVLVVAAGQRTRTNAATNPGVSLLWPALASGAYSLIVDGAAVGTDDHLEITPARAVLHRVVGAAGDGPGCVPVLSP